MGYGSRLGRKPFEYASRSSHGFIINDSAVVQLLHHCHFPKSATKLDLKSYEPVSIDRIEVNPVENIIAVDGGIAETTVRDEFPSSIITFFQFGALFFKLSDLEEVSVKPFIDPEDIARLNNIERVKFAFPTKNISYKEEAALTASARRAIYDFYVSQPSEEKFVDTLKWLLFEEYSEGVSTWNLASCPKCHVNSVDLRLEEMSKEYTFNCPACKGSIYLTDVFRLHEAIDDELGAGGVIGYMTNLFEHLLVLHLIRIIIKTKSSLLKHTLFIKDGPLAFFGQTANLHQPTRKLLNFLEGEYDIFMAGLEKSGAFVEHADQIAEKLSKNSALILSNDYIYKYIIPGTGDPASPYGRTTYFGNKLIFKTDDDQVYVVSIPTVAPLLSPKKSDFKNLDVILHNISKLKCDMYDSALIPVALANKLISLSAHPSSVILEKFAKEIIC